MEKLVILVPSLVVGGQERVAINAYHVLKKYFDVVICTFDVGERRYDCSECEVINFSVPSSKNIIVKVFHVFKRAYLLKKYIKTNQVDIIVSISSGANLINVLMGKQVFSMVQEHGYRATKLGILSRFIYNRADCIVAVSEGLRKKIVSYMPQIKEKCVRLYNPNMIDDILCMAKEEPTNWIPEKQFKYICACGRLEIVKNYPRLIKAFYLLQLKYPEWRLVIIGEGSEVFNLKMLVEKLGISDKVEFTGLQLNPFSYMARCDLYVLSSYNEGLSNTLIEGMCFSPVIAVDCKVGPKEIISENIDIVVNDVTIADYGILVPAAQNSYNKSLLEDINCDDESLFRGIECMAGNVRLSRAFKNKGILRARNFDDKNYEVNLMNIFNRFR